ncbi:hypothetical protein BCR37DRAFT_380996 [Protomyces lactucae-debilis]|uniref:Chitin synthesis regulation, resistance to congo red-domain-containing protein n=1 Tax=Protomyces lactucae-debilis TaxID=2754530 RepID=A0A1Y2F8Y9_PROLT|nr:uncharacterized protein BCR37DRAFT_380996 [Protomyces lactucae-debilis]ORY80333.1 hypothetical protein BCR37DRAFT_380996 [Protomyces lactucae-debilis]
MYIDKRQFSYGWYDNGSGYYWKEWVIFALILVAVLCFILTARAMGRRRINQGLALQTWHKWLFPARLRNGPPYAPATTAGVVSYHSAVGGPTRFGNGSGIAPPPPSYDPYATNLPAYQPITKGNGDHPEYEMVYTTQPVQADHGRPSSSGAPPPHIPSQPPMTR